MPADLFSYAPPAQRTGLWSWAMAAVVVLFVAAIVAAMPA